MLQATTSQQQSTATTISSKNDTLSVGDKLFVSWPSEEDGARCESKPLVGKVLEIISSKKVKGGSNLKYKIFFSKLNETRVMRLHDLEWSVKKKNSKIPCISEEAIPVNQNQVISEVKERKFKKPKLTSLSMGSKYNPVVGKIFKEHLHHILAPMVGASELPFRLLCRRYGATLAYTPMISSDRFAVDAKYRAEEFQTISDDRPLVAHFSANNPEVFLAAAKHVENSCDAIDLNLGCPQRVAHSGHFGSFLLDKEDRPLVMKMVKTLADHLTIPIFVKIRLLSTVDESLELCQQLIDSGAALIAIHARYRVNLVGRTGPGARDGAAHLDQVQEIISRLRAQGGRYGEVPIIANGNVRSWSDVQDNLSLTSADGIMSAEGLLDNPALFHRGATVDAVQLAEEYLDLVERFPTKMKSVVFHIRRMCRELLTSFQLLEECVSCATLAEMRSVLTLLTERRDSGNFKWDADKEKKAKEAIERRKREEGKRKSFEDRMKRKAKREGLAADHYLRIGAAPPTKAEIDGLKALPKEQAMALWKKDHAQHCYDFHFNQHGCLRDRTCAFLHSEFTANLTSNEELEVYG